MAKKSSVLSQQEKLKKMSGKDIYKVTPNMMKELEELAAMPDSSINLNDSDAPLINDWKHATRGQFYRKAKS